MPRTLKAVIVALPARERRKIKTRGARLIAEEVSLPDLREAVGKTQR